MAAASTVRARGADGLRFVLRDGAVGDRLGDLRLHRGLARVELRAQLLRLAGGELARALFHVRARLGHAVVDVLLERGRGNGERDALALRAAAIACGVRERGDSDEG